MAARDWVEGLGQKIRDFLDELGSALQPQPEPVPVPVRVRDRRDPRTTPRPRR